jgi:hypothetical protein
MVTCRFLTYTELESLFKASSKYDLKTFVGDSFLICSVGDVLYLSEQFKKNNLKVSFDRLNESFVHIQNQGEIYFPEIDRENLLENLFNIDSDNNVVLWEKACNPKISPRFSISLIALRPNEYTIWQSEIFEEMEAYFLSFEKY